MKKDSLVDKLTENVFQPVALDPAKVNAVLKTIEDNIHPGEDYDQRYQMAEEVARELKIPDGTDASGQVVDDDAADAYTLVVNDIAAGLKIKTVVTYEVPQRSRSVEPPTQ